MVTNHRQGEDRDYAEILNRIRIGDIHETDIAKLNERVQSLANVPKDAAIITCKNKDVNKINEQKLNEMTGQEYTIEATARTETQKTLKPSTEASGAIRNTPLQKTLKIKIGARIMLTYNLDTCDSLTNGTFGTIIGIDKIGLL